MLLDLLRHFVHDFFRRSARIYRRYAYDRNRNVRQRLHLHLRTGVNTGEQHDERYNP
ncbi:hypothetical protein D3C84_992750 [compost metagenome]